MDENNEADVNTPVDVEAPTEATTLHRSASKKIFGGVAGGIGERFDVDANIIRVVFVVLALVYGLGVAVYLAMWVLIPRSTIAEGEEKEVLEVESGNRFHWLRYVLPLGVIVLGIIFLATFRGHAKVGAGFGLFWLLFIVVLALFALRIPARRLTIRRFFALGFLALLTFLIFALGAALIALQVIGVPLKGGSGDRVWHPVTANEVQRQYHGAIGRSLIDLENVHFGAKTYTITATQGVGTLIVDIPSNVTVDLRTHVGIGGIQRFFVYESAPTSGAPTSTKRQARLILNLQVGIGAIQLFRVHP